VSISPKLFVAAVFLIAYVLLILLYHRKIYVVWAAVAVLLALRYLSPLEAWKSIEWNVILLYFGMLLVSESFLYSRMPDYLATVLAGRAGRVSLALLLLHRPFPDRHLRAGGKPGRGRAHGGPGRLRIGRGGQPALGGLRSGGRAVHGAERHPGRGFGQHRGHGNMVRFGQFVRIGLPFTLAAVAASTLFGWVIWG
jgi:hypothetical protein